MPPISNISPFSYRDGATYLEILYALRDYINITLRPEFDTEMQALSDQFQAGISNAEAEITAQEADWTTRFDAYMADVNNSLQALNDAAMGSLIGTPTSATAIALSALYGDTALAAEVNNPASALSQALAALYAGKTGVDTLDTLTSTGRLSQTALDAAYVNETDYATDKAANTTADNALSAAVAARANLWQSGNTYASGQLAISPAGDVLTALDTHTAGAVMDPAHWTGDFGYLFANFTYNSIDAERLNLFYSPDGVTVLGHGPNPLYTPATGVRDPSVKKIGNTWFMAYGFDQATNQTSFAVASSPDLVNWTLVTTVNVSATTGISQAWAPEITIDSNGDVYIFYTNATTSGTMEMWYVKAVDPVGLTSFTGVAKLAWTAQPAKAMDAIFQQVGNTWYMFYGDNNYVCRATATSLLGPWTVDKSGDWAGWGINREAPELVRVSPTKWRLYIDRYAGASPNWTYPGYGYTESTDLTTWTPLVPVNLGPDLSQIVIRHGSFIKIGDAKTRNQVIGAMLSGASNHQHIEVTATTNIPTVTETPMSAWALDTAMSSGKTDSYDYSVAGQVKIRDTGTYNADFHVGEDAVNNLGNGTTQHWVTIYSPTIGRNVARNSGQGGYESSASVSGLFCRAGDILIFRVSQWTGGTQTVKGRARITRVG